MAAPTLRSEAAELVSLAERDLSALWKLVAGGASAEVALRDLLPAIITTYGSAGAAVAAEWYDNLRDKVGATGRFAADPVEADDRGAHALIGWALDEATDDASLQKLILGGTQRRIVDHLRYTVAGSSVADPAARGWQRVGVGGNCPFCTMLIGRGAVYSEAGADFGSHDNCNCQATPAFAGQPVPVKAYTPSSRSITDADRARVRAWIASH